MPAGGLGGKPKTREAARARKRLVVARQTPRTSPNLPTDRTPATRRIAARNRVGQGARNPRLRQPAPPGTGIRIRAERKAHAAARRLAPYVQPATGSIVVPPAKLPQATRDHAVVQAYTRALDLAREGATRRQLAPVVAQIESEKETATHFLPRLQAAERQGLQGVDVKARLVPFRRQESNLHISPTTPLLLYGAGGVMADALKAGLALKGAVQAARSYGGRLAASEAAIGGAGRKVEREVERAALKRAGAGARLQARTGVALGVPTRIGGGVLSRAAGHPIAASGAAAITPELFPGGHVGRALEGQGRLANLTAHDTLGGVLGIPVNALLDATNLPAQFIPMIYLPAKAMATGDGQALAEMWYSFQQHDPAGALTRLDFGDFLRNIQQHPLYAGLEFAGVHAAFGRGLGAAVRATSETRGQYGLGTRTSIPLGFGREAVPRSASPNYVSSVIQRHIIDPRLRKAWAAGAGVKGSERPASVGLMAWHRAAALRRSANKYNIRQRDTARRFTNTRLDEQINDVGAAADLGVASPAVGLAIRNLLRGGDAFTTSARLMLDAGKRALEARRALPDGRTELVYPPNLPGRRVIEENIAALEEVLRRPEYYYEKIGLARAEFAKVHGILERDALDQKLLFGGAPDPLEAAIRARIKPSALTHGGRERGYYFGEGATDAERAAAQARGEKPLPGGVVKDIPAAEARPVPPEEPGGPLAPQDGGPEGFGVEGVRVQTNVRGPKYHVEQANLGNNHDVYYVVDTATGTDVARIVDGPRQAKAIAEGAQPRDVTNEKRGIREDRPTMGAVLEDGEVVTWRDGATHGEKLDELGAQSIGEFTVIDGQAKGFFSPEAADALAKAGLDPVDVSVPEHPLGDVQEPPEGHPSWDDEGQIIEDADAGTVSLKYLRDQGVEGKLLVNEHGESFIWTDDTIHSVKASEINQHFPGEMVAEGYVHPDGTIDQLFPRRSAGSDRPDLLVEDHMQLHESLREAGFKLAGASSRIGKITPGKYGRGIVMKNGDVHTWDDNSEGIGGAAGMTTHADYIHEHGISFADEAGRFEVGADGRAYGFSFTANPAKTVNRLLDADSDVWLGFEEGAFHGVGDTKVIKAIRDGQINGVDPEAAPTTTAEARGRETGTVPTGAELFERSERPPDEKRLRDNLALLRRGLEQAQKAGGRTKRIERQVATAQQKLAEFLGPKQLPPGPEQAALPPGGEGQPPALPPEPPATGGGGVVPEMERQGVETVRVPTQELIDWSIETGGWGPEHGGAIPFHLSEADVPAPKIVSRGGFGPGRIGHEVTTGETAGALASPSSGRQIVRSLQARTRTSTRTRMYDQIVRDQGDGTISEMSAARATREAAQRGYPEGSYYVVNRRAFRDRENAAKLIEEGTPEAYELDNLAELYDRDSGWIDSAIHDPTTGGIRDEPGGDWTVIPRESGDELLDTLHGTDKLDASLSIFTHAFKSAVLPTSTKWLFANYFDTTLRSIINGLVPPPFAAAEGRLGRGRVGTARRIMEASPAPMGVSEVEATLIPRGLVGSQSAATGKYSFRDPQQYTRLPVSERNVHGWLQAVGHLRDVKKIDDVLKVFAGYRHIVYKVNGDVVEEPLFEGMLGKVAAHELKRTFGDWHRTMETQEAAIRSMAQGLHGDPGKMQAFARAINKQTGNWNLLSPAARSFMLRYSPFYMWYRAASRFVLVTMPVNHPLITGIAAAAANMTEDERRILGLDKYADLPSGVKRAPSYLQGGLPRGGGLMPTATQTSFGIFADYPETLSNAIIPQFNGLFMGFRGLRWTGDRFTDKDGKEITNETVVAAFALGTQLEAFLPWMSMLTTAIGRGRQKLAPGVYRGDKSESFWKALSQAIIPAPLPGARVYKPQEQPGAGGAGGKSDGRFKLGGGGGTTQYKLGGGSSSSRFKLGG